MTCTNPLIIEENLILNLFFKQDMTKVIPLKSRKVLNSANLIKVELILLMKQLKAKTQNQIAI